MTVRTRTRGGFSATSSPYVYAYPQSCANRSWFTYGSQPPVLGGIFETMTDTVIPHFRERRAKGELFFNGMAYQRHEWRSAGQGAYITSVANACTGPAIKAEYDWQGNWSTKFIESQSFNGSTLPRILTIVPQSTVRDFKSQVSTELLAKRGHSDSNLFESLAEANQTIGLFDRPLERLTRAFNKAAEAKQKGRFTGYTLDGVSHLWLMYRYGISPALRDIEGIIEGLQKKTQHRRQTTRAKKSFELKESRSSERDFDIIRMTVSCDIVESYTCRAFSVDEYSTSLWENIGFSSKGLATVPWELLRFSFVYDWFLNIGDFINAQVPAFGWKSLGQGLVTIHGVTNRYKVTGGQNLNSGYTVSRYPTGYTDINILERTREGLSHPDIVIKNDFRFNRFTRVGDAFALLAQQGKELFHPSSLGNVVKGQPRVIGKIPVSPFGFKP